MIVAWPLPGIALVQDGEACRSQTAGGSHLNLAPSCASFCAEPTQRVRHRLSRLDFGGKNRQLGRFSEAIYTLPKTFEHAFRIPLHTGPYNDRIIAERSHQPRPNPCLYSSSLCSGMANPTRENLQEKNSTRTKPIAPITTSRLLGTIQKSASESGASKRLFLIVTPSRGATTAGPTISHCSKRTSVMMSSITVRSARRTI